jgi:hypothetical protein
MEDLTNMIKPVVHFVGKARFDTMMYDTEVAHVYAEDHPILGRDKIRTSTVIKKFSDGSFETRNTIYRPLKKDPLEIMAENARELGLDYDT